MKKIETPAKSLKIGSPDSRFKWVSLVLSVVMLILFVTMATFLAGCSGGKSSPASANQENLQKANTPVGLTVSAAVSLKDALEKIAPSFEKKENAKLFFNFGSSGDLQTQVEQGAPVDIFISAGKKQIDALAQEGLIKKKSCFNWLGNDLVVVVPKTSKMHIAKLADLTTSNLNKIAIGEPESVPAGQYSKETLEKAGIWLALQPKIVMAEDVRQVLGYVETGNVDAGFVYSSDAAISQGVKIILRVPDNYHKPIVYPVAMIASSRQAKIAAKFEDYLKSPEVLKVLGEFGFKIIAK